MTEVRRVAVIVAHPDDETLWAGGLLLAHPEWTTFIATSTHSPKGEYTEHIMHRVALGPGQDAGGEGTCGWFSGSRRPWVIFFN